ncbi:hypothetical protein niasHT_009416 [Heterodera trifolii]|uniref:signal peptidase I n=1 Tax=Heterodera trifolii TaxID=157864 RepID=A0ABD2MEC3_9BILA
METVKQKLFSEVEGTCTGKYGFVIAVTTIDTIGHGMIQPGQVIDAVVSQVNKVGIFCEIGPLSCFISRHCIPPDMEFEPNNIPPCYKTADESIVIKQDDEIRLKLIGIRVDANDIFAIGTLMDDYLEMGLFDLSIFDEFRRMDGRQIVYQFLNFAMIVSSALMIWKGLMVVTGSESPIVVVLSGSMEPAFYRGDLLMLTNDLDDPIRAGDITVFKIEGRDIPIVHRVIKVHEKNDEETKFLTKGDNNMVDDRGLYAPGQYWLQRKDVVGRAKGFVPYVGMVTIIMNDYPKLNSTKIHSNVIELNERFLDVKDKGLWFVVFYAPWCAHCKKMFPVWENLAHELADKNSAVRIGKLDCTRFSSVSSVLRINGYPTIIFFRNGVQLHYEGERRKDEMVKFVEKCSGPIVDKIGTPARFAELRKNSENEPFFVFFDPAQRAEEEGSPENELWRQFEKTSELLFTDVRFFELHNREILKATEEKLAGNETRIIAVKDVDYLQIFDAEKDDLEKWFGRNRWPFLTQISTTNIREIAESTGKLLVLSSIEGMDRHNASTESGSFVALIKRTVAEARVDAEIEQHFQFGWLDGAQIASGVVMDSLPLPNLVVLNYTSYEFYLSKDHPAQMTAKSLLLFLHNVRLGEVKVHGGRAWITRLRRMAYEITSNVYDMFRHQPILTVCLFGVPLAFFSIITYSICSADFSVERDEFYPDDEEEESLPLEELDESLSEQNRPIDSNKKAD